MTTQEDDKEDQASIIQARARILENPVYQKMPFYPYKDLLMWQEVEAQQRQNSGKQRNDLIYRQVRDTYLQLIKEQVQNYLKRNPNNNVDQLADDVEPEVLLMAIYGDGVTAASIEDLRNTLFANSKIK